MFMLIKIEPIILKKKDISIFTVKGAEAFNYMTEDYIHINYVPINHATLNSPSTWQLDRFLILLKLLKTGHI